MEKKTKFELCIACVLLLAVSAVISFYCVHNANWVIGDDMMFARSTAIGKPFMIWGENIRLDQGRFCPLGQQHNNLLLFLQPEGVSVKLMYWRNAIQALIFPILLFFFLWGIMKENFRESRFVPFVILLFIIAFLERISAMYFFELIYGGMFSFFLFLLFLWSEYRWQKTEQNQYTVISSLTAGYLIFMREDFFLMFAVYACACMILQWKNLQTKGKVHYLLIFSCAVLYVLLYVLYVLPHIKSAYAVGDEGEYSYIKSFWNALMMQKVGILAIILLGVRLVDVYIRKAKAQPYFDALLVAGVVGYMGNIVLKLTLSNYYNPAIFLMLPALVYYLVYYLRGVGAFMVALVFGGFYLLKLPKDIAVSQRDRKEQFPIVERMVEQVRAGQKCYVFLPTAEDENDMHYHYYVVVQNFMRMCLRDTTYEIPILRSIDTLQDEHYVLIYPTNMAGRDTIPMPFAPEPPQMELPSMYIRIQ